MRALVITALLALAACEQATAPQTNTTQAAAPANTITPASLPAFFDCLRTHSQTIVEAHRGGNVPGFAENALETFAHTLSLAPAMMEIDIAKTKDGALVLMHDDTVDRTTNGHGAVSDLTLAQVQALTLKDDDRQALAGHPPTLQAALDWANGKTILFLDIKPSVSYEEVVAAVRAAHAENRIVFITYTNDEAAHAFRIAPDFMLSVSLNSERDLNALMRRGLDPAHMLAWTGIDEPNSALNVALAQHGVESMFGTLGGANSWDVRFAREHREQYAAFAETGLQVIGTDRAPEAARDLDANDGVGGYGYKQCEAAR